MHKKIQKIFFGFEITAFELVALNTRFYWERILFIGYQYVNKQSQDFRYYQHRIFRAHFLSHCSKNTRKILACWFRRFFEPLNMLAAHKCSDTRLFRHLSNLAFCSLLFQNHITSETHLFFKVFKMLTRFRKCRK